MVIITAVYILVAIAAIGARPWTEFTDGEAAFVGIVAEITGQPIVALFFSIGAVIAIASVVLDRALRADAHLRTDGARRARPEVLGRVSRRTGHPVAGTLIVGGSVPIVAALSRWALSPTRRASAPCSRSPSSTCR